MITETLTECGCCDQWHRESYAGDCRNDLERIPDPGCICVTDEDEASYEQHHRHDNWLRCQECGRAVEAAREDR